VRVFDSVKKNEEALRSFGCEQVFQFERGFRGGQCSNALMFARAAEAIELHPVFESYGDAFRAGQLNDGFHAVAATAASDHDAIERASGGQRFFYGMESGEPVHGWRDVCGQIILNQEQIPL
jgi:hypothetical protein